MSKDQQAANLPRLVELLDNIWFKHFVATWQEEKERTIIALIGFPISGLEGIVSMLQIRGAYNAYDQCIKQAYETYNNLVKQKEENERTNNDSGRSSVDSDVG